MKTMKKIVAILAVALLLCSVLPLSVMAADTETIKYTISSYPAGTQYKAETHELDDYLTVITNTRCHFTTELRIYAPNGGVNGEVILASTREMTEVVLNAGNKTSTLTVSTSPDNSTWTQHSTLSVASSYKDLPINNLPAGTKYVKLVNGSGQVRVKYITVSYAADVVPEEPEVPSTCEHVWVDANCTTPKTCSECGATEGEALGHDWEIISEEEATCTADGSTTYECAACGEDKVETIPALPHNYVDGFCSACGDKEPDGFVLVTDVNDLKVGDTIIIVAADENYAMGAQKTNNRDSVAITKADNVIVPVDGIQIITLEAGLVEGTFAFNTGAGYLYAASSSGNHLKTQTKLDNNGSWQISIAGGVVSIVAQGDNARNVMQYNPNTNNGDPLFACYAADKPQKPVAIYKQSAEPACEHEYDNACDVDCNLCGETREVSHAVKHVEAKAATCAANGNIEYWYCDVCGMAWLNAECTMNTNLRAVVLPATGEHTYTNAFDTICDVCGAERSVVNPIAFDGKSVSEDVSGLAFKFNLTLEGVAIKNNTWNRADFTNATLGDYKVIRVGAIATNSKSTIDIAGVHMCEFEGNHVSFAFRVINIPESGYDTEITMTPYIVLEIDGVETTIEGEAQTASYNQVANV